MKYVVRMAAVCAAVTVAVLTAGCKAAVKPDGGAEKPVGVRGVTVDRAEVNLAVGGTETLTATVSPHNAADKKVSWSSDKPEIASVDEAGTVTAKKTGKAVITVTTGGGKHTATCTVTVFDYLITYDLNGGRNDSANPAGYNKGSAVISLKDAQRIGYEFKGWYETVDFSGGKVTEIAKGSEGNKKVYAKWEAITYTISYELDRGTNDSGNPAMYTIEDTVSLKAATKPDHEFKGWYEKADFSGEKVTEIAKGSMGNKTLYARFEEEFVDYQVGGVSFRMMNIRAVTDGSVGHDDQDGNKPHRVSLTAYRIGETEVTQELWEKVMGENPSNFTSDAAAGEVQEKRPVEQVSWYKCIAFCNELTKKVNGGSDTECVYYLKENDATVHTKDHAQAGKEPVQKLEKKGFRLPTEAEWEWAAKGGTEDKWAGTDSEGDLGNYAWYDTNSDRKTHEVKKKLANGYQLYDMSGNVRVRVNLYTYFIKKT